MHVLEIFAYLIIGLAAFLAVGGAVFLIALRVYDRVEEWQLERTKR